MAIWGRCSPRTAKEALMLTYFPVPLLRSLEAPFASRDVSENGGSTSEGAASPAIPPFPDRGDFQSSSLGLCPAPSTQRR